MAHAAGVSRWATIKALVLLLIGIAIHRVGSKRVSSHHHLKARQTRQVPAGRGGFYVSPTWLEEPDDDDDSNSRGHSDEESSYVRSLAASYSDLFRTSWGAVRDRTKGVQESIQPGRMEYRDGAPIWYKAPSGREAVVCHVPKAGSTRWKSLLYKGATGEQPAGGEIHSKSVEWLRPYEKRQAELIKSPNATRVMWLRNPYVRLLSGFLDKATGFQAKTKAWKEKIMAHGGPYRKTKADFARFVWFLVGMNVQGTEMDPHFMPMLETCGLDKGMRYDLYVKAEEMDEWYADLIHLLGLEAAAGSGWDFFPKFHKGQEDLYSCFFTLPGLNCNQTSAAMSSRAAGEPAGNGSLQGGSSGSRGKLSWMQSASTFHAKGSDGLVAQYYTREVAQMAELMLQPDLDAFGYPNMEFDTTGTPLYPL